MGRTLPILFNIGKEMNDIKVTIMYRDGQEETCYVTDHSIKNGCLSLYKRYKETRYIPLDTIKEWKVK